MTPKNTIIVIDDVREQRDSLVSNLRNVFKESFVISLASAEEAKRVLGSKEELKKCIIVNHEVEETLTRDIIEARVAFEPFLKEIHQLGYKTTDEYNAIQYDKDGSRIKSKLEKYFSEYNDLEEKVEKIKKLLEKRSELDKSLLYNVYKDDIEDNPNCLNILCIIVDMIDGRNADKKFMGLEVFLNVKQLKETQNPYVKDTLLMFYTGQLGTAIDFKNQLTKYFPDKEWTQDIELAIMRNLKTLIIRKNMQDELQLVRHIYQCIWNIDTNK